MDYAPKKGSTVGSVVAFVREVCFPVGVHLLALPIELASCCELVIVHLRCGVQDVPGSVEYEQLHVRGYLEGLPGDRNIFFIKPKNPALGDHQIGDLVSLRTHHEIFDAA